MAEHPHPGINRRTFLATAGLTASASFATGLGLGAQRTGQAGAQTANPAEGASSRNTADPQAKDLTPQQDTPNLPGILVENVPATGQHQPGIIDTAPPAMEVLGLNFTPGTTKDQVGQALKVISDLARTYAVGTYVQQRGVTRPANDNGILGSPTAIDGVRFTVGLGASLFDDRFGLRDRKPIHLDYMQPFADDSLDPALCHGDLCLQVAANHSDAVLHATRMVLRRLRGRVVPIYRYRGYLNPPRPEGTQRNHFGFRDGTAQPDIKDPQVAADLLWAGADEPTWAADGTYLVVRLIRMYVEFWDRISISEQEDIFGRDRLTGAPLSGGDEFTAPDYENDPGGAVTALTSHIRLANPRQNATANSLILRRGYNYDNGVNQNGTLDLGLIFMCYQQDIERQFATMQRRLEGEPLADYIQPFGGGYYFCPRGLREDPADYVARDLLEG